MHWESFYVNPENVYHNELILDGDEFHHLSRVLRKKKGDIIWAVDGKGAAYKTELLDISKSEARGKIIQTRRRLGEPVIEITLAQGLLRGERFDWLVEKATEIGVHHIIPLQIERSNTTAGPQKLSRWKRIALSAMKQSGRTILPEISVPKSFTHILALGTDCHYRLMAHPNSDSQSIAQCDPHRINVTPRVLLVVGSEGGFTDQEVEQAIDNGFKMINLGPRRLRSETAGLVLITWVLAQLGEIM